MNHNQIHRCDTEGLTSRSDAFATAIHICLRQQYRCLFTGHSANAVEALVTFALQGDPTAFCQARSDHETDIVASFGIVRAGVA